MTSATPAATRDRIHVLYSQITVANDEETTRYLWDHLADAATEPTSAELPLDEAPAFRASAVPPTAAEAPAPTAA
jgi:hypothetical protein